jgi:hypothetical protein
VRFEVFMAVRIFSPEDGERNVVIYLLVYTAPKPRITTTTSMDIRLTIKHVNEFQSIDMR